jgi:hypothetical protein
LRSVTHLWGQRTTTMTCLQSGVGTAPTLLPWPHSSAPCGVRPFLLHWLPTLANGKKISKLSSLHRTATTRLTTPPRRNALRLLLTPTRRLLPLRSRHTWLPARSVLPRRSPLLRLKRAALKSLLPTSTLLPALLLLPLLLQSLLLALLRPTPQPPLLRPTLGLQVSRRLLHHHRPLLALQTSLTRVARLLQAASQATTSLQAVAQLLRVISLATTSLRDTSQSHRSTPGANPSRAAVKPSRRPSTAWALSSSRDHTTLSFVVTMPFSRTLPTRRPAPRLSARCSTLTTCTRTACPSALLAICLALTLALDGRPSALPGALAATNTTVSRAGLTPWSDTSRRKQYRTLAITLIIMFVPVISYFR